MRFKGWRFLVTGGAGFIGSTIADALLAEGAAVRVLDNLLTGDMHNVNPRVEFIEGDVRDPEAVRKALREVTVVFHEAAQINPAKAVEDPLFDFEINARGTLNVLLAAREAGVRKLIMASTNVYGDADLQVMPESFSTLAEPRSLLSPYAAAKVCAEAYLKVAADELGFPTVRLRYFNVFGPRQLTKSESGVIALFAQAALRGDPMRIFGDGSHTRDFVYVEDVAEANLRAAALDAANGGVFNVGTGVETSVRQVAEKVNEITDARVPIQYVQARAADFRRAKAELSLSRSVLGYEPTVDFDTGMRRYIDWLRVPWTPQQKKQAAR
jgi:UDP-glucose 4-epimerase